jgi:hypothetical protein
MLMKKPIYAALDLHSGMSVLGSMDHGGRPQPRRRFATEATIPIFSQTVFFTIAWHSDQRRTRPKLLEYRNHSFRSASLNAITLAMFPLDSKTRISPVRKRARASA